ncbi:hypothetical protein YC2023_117801 [Brassica napus]
MDGDLLAKAWWGCWCFPDEISIGRWKLSVEGGGRVKGRVMCVPLQLWFQHVVKSCSYFNKWIAKRLVGLGIRLLGFWV